MVSLMSMPITSVAPRACAIAGTAGSQAAAPAPSSDSRSRRASGRKSLDSSIPIPLGTYTAGVEAGERGRRGGCEAMARIFGVAMVGLGMAVQPHALALRDLEAAGRGRLLRRYRPSAARRGGFAARWGVPGFPSLEALLAAPGLDLVLVLTPPGAHLPIAEAA